MLKTSAKKLENITLSNQKKQKRMICSKIKHVFIVRDQNSKTDLYTLNSPLDCKLSRLLSHLNADLLIPAFPGLGNYGEFFHLPPSLHCGNNIDKMVGQD